MSVGFPKPDYDSDVRQAYKGGFTYLHSPYKEKDIGEGLVMDVNSLYPWVMHDCPLPYGEPVFFKGEYQYDKYYPLYVQMITCQFELKPGYIPTIQDKSGFNGFSPTEYLIDSGDREVTMCLTSVDLELFKEHYEIYNPVYHSGWKFRSTVGLFTDYIDKWMQVKIESTKNGNKAMRTLSKLMLNALYGKFGSKIEVGSKYPEYDNGKIVYKTPKDEFGKPVKDRREPVYIPVATFVTAWARHKTITSAQKMYKYFVYADTDSLHLRMDLPDEVRKMSNDELEQLTTEDLRKLGLEFPEDFVIDPVALGAWKLESKFTRARFLRQKSYIEDSNPCDVWESENYNKNLLKITCAGMPKSCYDQVDWDNFKVNSSFEGKLVPKHVNGGIVLVDTIFTIKPT